MNYKENRNIHRPKHIYLDDKIYFITGRTYEKVGYFYDDKRKELLKRVLVECIKRFDIKIFAWVILDNHYHILFKPGNKFRSAQFVNPYKKNVKMRGTNYPRKRNDEMSETNFVNRYQLIEFIRKLHKDSSRIINKLDNKKGRKIWYQYWDHCIRDEKDFYKHFNYIHNNPIKHRKVKNINELKNYKYSSFNSWIKKKSREWINSSFELYPIHDFTFDNE